MAILGDTDPMLRRSADNKAMVPYWDKTDTILGGINALKAAGTDFLPKFQKENDDSYKNRIMLTKVTNIWRDIVESLASKPFEQEVKLKRDEDESLPDKFDEFEEDVDGAGNHLSTFAAQMMFYAINSAIDWLFVDFPSATKPVRNMAEAKAANLRPYWSRVIGRNVLEARSKIINGKEMLVYVRIYEPGNVDHIRVFERLETGEIIWFLYEKRETTRDMPDGSGKTAFHEIDGGTLSIREIPVIPFITGRRNGRSFLVDPALNDAADLQIDLYQQESALKYIKTLSAYPMLAGNGVKPRKGTDGLPEPIVIGPGVVLYAEPNGAGGAVGEWTFIEPGASSLTFLASDIKDTIQNLRELGKQPLTAQSGNLTVITTAIAAGKSRSAVVAWALGLKNVLEHAMNITGDYMAITMDDYRPQIEIYTDFDETKDDAADIEALNAARERKDISRETYWEEFKRRGILSAEFDADKEEKRLLDELPGDGEDRVFEPSRGNNPDDKINPPVPA